MSEKPIIAYLTHSITYGGATQSLILLQKAIEPYQYKMHLLYKSTVNENLLDEFRPFNKEIKKIKIARIDYNQTTQISLFKFVYRSFYKPVQLVEYLEKNKIDILHINTSVFSSSLKYIKENSNVKIITHVRELIRGDKRKFIKNYIIKQIEKYSEIIITISPNEAECFKKSRKLVVVPNPFDFENIKNIPLEDRRNNTVVRIGMIANFSRSKGILEFIKAINIINKSNLAKYRFKASIIGIDLNYRSPMWKRIIKTLLFKQNYLEQVLNYIRKNNLDPIINLVSFTTTPLKEINKLDVVVRPSRSNDPWGRDIIEAMALKKAVIATGNSEFFIKNGETGFLVPSGLPIYLAAKICELINNSDRRTFFGEMAFRRVKELCDLNKYGEIIHSIYSSVMN